MKLCANIASDRTAVTVNTVTGINSGIVLGEGHLDSTQQKQRLCSRAYARVIVVS